MAVSKPNKGQFYSEIYFSLHWNDFIK